MCTRVKQHAFCWGNLKEMLLEYDGKSYREFLILLGEDVKLSEKKADVCAWVWEESIYDLFQRIIPDYVYWTVHHCDS